MISQEGFSTLLSIFVIWFLLIISTGVLNMYMTEMKINRSLYNGITTYAWAEWSLEYALLKSKNHRDGFWDAVSDIEPDSNLLSGYTRRINGLRLNYTFQNHSNNFSGTIQAGEHLIFPLFIGTGTVLGWSSIHPNKTDLIAAVKKQLTLTMGWPLGWNIIMIQQSNGETIGITGTGNISIHYPTLDQTGVIREYIEESIQDIWWDVLDTQEYFIHSNTWVANFLNRWDLTEPYLLIFNPGNVWYSVELQTDSPFALPMNSIVASSHIGTTAKQTIEFSEDKSKYYESLKYGLFMDNENN